MVDFMRIATSNFEKFSFRHAVLHIFGLLFVELDRAVRIIKGYKCV